MHYRADLNGGVRVHNRERDLGAPPSRSAAVLLVGLLTSPNTWFERSLLAEKLYPTGSSDRSAALRQTLLRLRQWLGDGALQFDCHRVRLAPDRWEGWIRPGELLPAAIASGNAHPWLDELRAEFGKQHQPAPWGPSETWRQSVMELAKVDRDEARGLFTAGAALQVHIPLAERDDLFSLVQPRKATDPYAWKYFRLRAMQRLDTTRYQLALLDMERAHGIAVRSKQRGARADTLISYFFTLIESGRLSEAASVAPQVEALARRSDSAADALNSLACFEWNAGDTDAALRRIGQGASLPDATHGQRLHLLATRALLLGYVGDVGQCQDAVAALREVARPQLDLGHLRTTELAWTLAEIASGELDRALHRIEPLLHGVGVFGGTVNYWAAEIHCEVLAKLGRGADARRTWGRVQSARRSGGCFVTPRIEQKQARLALA